jgi:hypothetical protein
MEKHIQKYLITVITPTILRPELKLLCDYIDNANKELGNIQHLVMVDKEILTEEDEQLLSSIRNKDREINMVFKEKPYNDYGNLARATAYPFIKGRYVINVDDDMDLPINDLFNKFCELLVMKKEHHDLIIFPALRGGVRFFNIPAGKCRTVSCQYFYKPIIKKKKMIWKEGTEYTLDGDFLEEIMGLTTPYYWDTEKPLIRVDNASRGLKQVTKL